MQKHRTPEDGCPYGKNGKFQFIAPRERYRAKVMGVEIRKPECEIARGVVLSAADSNRSIAGGNRTSTILAACFRVAFLDLFCYTEGVL